MSNSAVNLGLADGLALSDVNKYLRVQWWTSPIYEHVCCIHCSFEYRSIIWTWGFQLANWTILLHQIAQGSNSPRDCTAHISERHTSLPSAASGPRGTWNWFGRNINGEFKGCFTKDFSSNNFKFLQIFSIFINVTSLIHVCKWSDIIVVFTCLKCHPNTYCIFKVKENQIFTQLWE